MNKIKVIAVTLAVVFMAVSASFAQPHEGYGQGSEMPKGRVPQELNLKSEQQKELIENRKAQHEQMEKLHNAIRQKQEQLQQALNNPAATQATVAPLVKELKALQGGLIDLRVKGILEVKRILTPEQFLKFQQMTEERRKSRPQRN